MSRPESNARDAHERATHNRLILAPQDLEEARGYALLLVEDPPPQRPIADALNSAMIVAYGRCFSGEQSLTSEALPRLPDRFLKALSESQQKVHQALLTLRHKEFAHSDADVARITMTRWVFPAETFVAPDHRTLRVPLPQETVERVIDLINTLRLSILRAVADIQERFKDEGEIPTQRAF
jgi:hypothetical protein